eukprot:2302472-Rhodomonas_salina.1
MQDSGGTERFGIDLSVVLQFDVVVEFVNQAPGFALVRDRVSVLEDAAPYFEASFAVNITKGPENLWAEVSQSLVFIIGRAGGNDRLAGASEYNGSAANDTLGVFPRLSADGSLTFTVALDENGNATYVVRLEDSGGVERGGSNRSTDHYFTIHAEPVNDRPSFELVSLIRTRETKSGFKKETQRDITTTVSTGPYNEGAQTWRLFLVNCTGDNLFKLLPSMSPAGVMAYFLHADVSGQTRCFFYMQDSGGVENDGVDISELRSVVIVVDPVNDAPRFTIPRPSISRFEVVPGQQDVSVVTIPSFVQRISPGPADESGQAVSFAVSPSNLALFQSPPTITVSGRNGNLYFELAPLQYTSSPITFEVVATDDGGTERNGTNTSSVQLFSLLVEFVNQPPVVEIQNNVTWVESQGTFSLPGFVLYQSTVEPMQNISFTVDLVDGDVGLFASQPVVSAQ